MWAGANKVHPAEENPGGCEASSMGGSREPVDLSLRPIAGGQ